MKKSTHQLAVVAQDGLPQRVVQQDLVWEVHELADAAVQGASGAGLAGLAAPWSAKRGEAAAAGAQARPRPAGLGIGSALPRKALLGSAVEEDGTPRHTHCPLGPPTHSSARAAPWTRAQARPCRPGEGATERVSSATARTPRCQGSPGEQGAHRVPFRRAAKPLAVRRRMHASLLTHPWPFPLLQDARMQNKQGPIFTWERQTRCVASMRGTGIRLGPSRKHPFLPRSPHAMQRGHALAPHTGLPRSAWCNFSGSRCSTHQIYRPQSQTGNKRGGGIRQCLEHFKRHSWCSPNDRA